MSCLEAPELDLVGVQSVSMGGVSSVEEQQISMAAISACLAAAGGMAVRAGFF